MQYVKNDLIIHSIYGLKNNICQYQLYTKKYDKFKKSRTAIEIASLDKNNLFIFFFIHTSLSCARIRKLPVHVHKAHVVKINIITGQEETGNLHFIL